MSKLYTQNEQTADVPENDQAGAEEAGGAAGNDAAGSRFNGQNPAFGCAAGGYGDDSGSADAGPEYGQDGADEPAELCPEAKIAELEAKCAELSDQYLRKAADFENFRKRMNQEKQNAIDFANQNLLLDIIPIIDDFERAIQAAGNSGDFAGQPAGQALLDGITMIEKRLSSQLETKWGLKRFDSKGEPFDPNMHEALMMEKSPDVTEPVVQEDLIKGYMLKDRVIRAAKVKVVMPETPAPAADNGGGA